jgi:hypothetical protein
MAEANVKNLEAIELFNEQVGKLREDTRKQVDEIREQLQRVSVWLQKELPEYWSNELRKAENRWIEAREELLRCQAKTRAEDETSCSFQQKQLDRATTRRRLCESKVRLLPECAMLWEQCLQELSTKVRQLDDVSESTLPNAMGRLHTTIEAIKKYTQT